MGDSVKEFMQRIIDYAGTFPPAKLPLDQAVIRFVEYANSDKSWMLGPFVIPTIDLSQAHSLLAKNTGLIKSKTLFFAPLIMTDLSSADWQQSLQKELDDIAGFLSLSSNYELAQIELKLPIEYFFGEKGVKRLYEIRNTVESLEIEPKLIYVEGMTLNSWDTRIPPFVRAIKQSNHNSRSEPLIGLKLRTGGLTKTAFPSTNFLAAVLQTISAERIPFKATAGLHHAIRHYNPALETMEHGFLNVFGALILGMHHELEMEVIAMMLEDQEPLHFSFDGGFCWNNYCVERDEIVDLRRYARSFGSCSFEEPVASLTEMSLLDP